MIDAVTLLAARGPLGLNDQGGGGNGGGGGGGNDGDWNPFDGVVPNFGPFQELLESRVNTILALIWVVALCYLGFRLVVNLTALARARGGRYGTDLNEARQDLAWSAGAVVAVAAVGAIYGALVVF